MKRRHSAVVLVLVCQVLLNSSLSAAVRLPGFFTDNLVLQREKPVPVWGWGDAGEKVVVQFAGQSKEATVDAAGRWQIRLDPMKASAEGQVLSVNQAIELKNVVVGDVWICSGQSNMEWALGRVANANAEIAAADYPLIRHIKINHLTSDVPMDDLQGTWEMASPATAGNFTAVGYFFGRRLHRELGVPIGLIGSNWGGTMIEPWTTPEGFAMVPELKAIRDRVNASDPSTEEGRKAYLESIAAYEKWLLQAEKAVQAGEYPPAPPELPTIGRSHQDPTRIYNAMIHPWAPYAIRGAIWYQGESNGSEGESYYHKMQALIGGWRKLWGQGAFPFYFVQLANFRNSPDVPEGGDGWAALREAQRKSLTIENTGMAVIIDIGEERNIHPTNKQDVGSRLAQWALAGEYGKGLVPSGPLYKDHMVEDGKIRISFDHAGDGLIVGQKQGLDPVKEVAGGVLKHFAIAGADKVWHWAEAVIDGKTVVVSSPQVAAPVAVRYAYRMNPVGANLYNREGLPASPFRTDGW